MFSFYYIKKIFFFSYVFLLHFLGYSFSFESALLDLVKFQNVQQLQLYERMETLQLQLLERMEKLLIQPRKENFEKSE